ncbi:hypothetical protein P8S54_09125 [Thiomicrospira sp. R3]|uniref:hypothetical protein n=1 Tax=Thiomicrospira sp. R3 TaxID=3035472 RepID=UPI00259B24AD|nr:hypothetical protein [Thiomicrospira sp. R3]WFE68367.1 hypothetical protein P8S54_09125 [Thiomicrospira sp. R3]
MELSPDLQTKMQKAIKVSMQIEGQTVSESVERRQYIKQLMESYGVKVSIPAKPYLSAKH